MKIIYSESCSVYIFQLDVRKIDETEKVLIFEFLNIIILRDFYNKLFFSLCKI